MQRIRGRGLVAAVLSLVLVLGSGYAAFAEGVEPTPHATPAESTPVGDDTTAPDEADETDESGETNSGSPAAPAADESDTDAPDTATPEDDAPEGETPAPKDDTAEPDIEVTPTTVPAEDEAADETMDSAPGIAPLALIAPDCTVACATLTFTATVEPGGSAAVEDFDHRATPTSNPTDWYEFDPPETRDVARGSYVISATPTAPDAEDYSTSVTCTDPGLFAGWDGTTSTLTFSNFFAQSSTCAFIHTPRGSSSITVFVGSDRTGINGVTDLAGVVLHLEGNTGSGGNAAPDGVRADGVAGDGPGWARCVSDANGLCTFTVPDTQDGGANHNQPWVTQYSAPAGYFTNELLRVGGASGDGSQLAYQFRMKQTLQAGESYSSLDANDLMLSSGSAGNASGGIWQQSRVNPTLTQTCGLDVALIMDFSGSVGNPSSLLAAADTFTDSLVGTPSKMSLFSFSWISPAQGATQNYPALTSVSTQAQADAFKARYASWNTGGGTNWDRGLGTANTANVGANHFDVAVVITDGSPTTYSDPYQGTGSNNRFRETEAGIFSANALKAKDTRVLAFGVGGGANGTNVALNLQAISGTTKFNGSNSATADYYQTTDYDAVGQALRELALGNCEGNLTVTKEIVPSGNTGNDISGATPAGAGWTFDTTINTNGVTTPDPDKTTTADGTGTVAFPLTFPGGVNSASVGVTETQQSGYTLIPVNGQNAVCTNLTTQQSVTPTANGALGFTVEVPSTDTVNCIMYNREPAPQADVTVTKNWVVNGTDYANGSQPAELQAQLHLTGPGAAGATDQNWDDTRIGYEIGDTAQISETVTTIDPDLCTQSAAVTSINGVDQDIPLGSAYDLVLTEEHNVATITNTVDCESRLSLEKDVEGGPALPTEWTLSAENTDGAPIAGFSGTSGQPDVTNIEVTPDARYQLFEDAGNPLYAQTDNRTNVQSNPLSTGSATCIRVDANGDPFPGSAWSDGINGGVNVPLGYYAKCTFVNETAELVLLKEVDNDYGGTATSSDWNLTATPDAFAGLSAETVVGSPSPVPASSFGVRPDHVYTLTESDVPGYEFSRLEQLVGGTWTTVVANPVAGEYPQQDADGNWQVTVDPLNTATYRFVNIDQPAQLTLVKTVTNDNGGTAVPTDWELTATGTVSTITGETGDPAVTAATVDAGAYTLSESGGPDGYTAGAWSCTGGTLSGDSVAVPSGGDVTCTINNDDDPATLTLVKTVTNQNGGTAVPTDWTLSADGPTPISGVTGSGVVTAADVDPGSYTLSEANGPAGYVAGDWSCIGGTQTGDSVAIALGDDVVCEINNADTPAKLTLVKTVTNDNGGTASPLDWTLVASGPTTISGPTASTDVTDADVSPGVYSLTETGGPDGYTAGDWSCVGGSVSGSDVTVPFAGDVTCTINNDDNPALLTLIKTVDNAYGGSAVPTDWTLFAAGPTPIAGPTGSAAVTAAEVVPGLYPLGETNGPDGYEPGDWTCVGGVTTGANVTVPFAGNVTCTITNSDIPAQLTLVKLVDNGTSGGTAVPTDWELTGAGQGVTNPPGGPATIEGVSGSAAVTSVPVPADDYDLSEANGPANYMEGDWSCTGTGGTLSGSTLSLALAGDMTCTITNTAIAPTLTLVKVVENGTSGGTAVDTDWTLTANGPVTIAGATGTTDVTTAPVSVGTYDLTEAGPSGYDAGDWSCTGGSSQSATSVTLDLGDNATCTIVNTAIAPKLTLVKVVNNGSSGTAVPTDWDLTGDGAVTITGTSGDAAVTSAQVVVGDYDLSEANGPADYDLSNLACVDDATGVQRAGTTVAAPSVTLALADEVTCTFTNVAVEPEWNYFKSSNPDSGATVTPGTVITYTVTAVRSAGVPATNVVITDDLSNVLNNAALVPGSIVTTDGTAEETGTDLVWTIPSLTATSTMTYQVTVNDDALGVEIGNVVTATGSNPPGPCPTDTPECRETHHFTPEWTVEKVSDPASGSQVSPGSVVAYTVTAHNTGPVVVTGAVVTDDLSDVLDNASLEGPLPAGVTISGTTATWAVPDIAVGGSESITYSVRINTDASDVTIGNVITATGPVPPTDCPAPDTGSVVALSVTAADPCSTNHHVPPPLPATGGSVAWGIGALGAGLLAAGLVLLVVRRRRLEGALADGA